MPPPAEGADVCSFPAHAPNAPEKPVQIVGVEKVEEVVTLRNVGAEILDLSGWTVCSVRGNERHEGIVGFLEPGESADFTHQGPTNIWSNTEPDDAVLYDEDNNLISYWTDPAGDDE
jgi:micrococcal nuclease